MVQIILLQLGNITQKTDPLLYRKFKNVYPENMQFLFFILIGIYHIRIYFGTPAKRANKKEIHLYKARSKVIYATRALR